MFRSIQPDKWKHFIVGIPMGSVLQIVCDWLMESQTNAIIAASVIVVAISYGFELFSKITGIGHYDFWDAVASAIGGMLGIGLVLIF
ncbi:MAG: hypothetical protein ACTHMM_07680 [Agriterribacter sp.]